MGYEIPPSELEEAASPENVVRRKLASRRLISGRNVDATRAALGVAPINAGPDIDVEAIRRRHVAQDYAAMNPDFAKRYGGGVSSTMANPQSTDEPFDQERAAAIMAKIRDNRAAGTPEQLSGGGTPSQGSLDAMQRIQAQRAQGRAALAQSMSQSPAMGGGGSAVATLRNTPGFAYMHPQLQASLYAHAMQQDAESGRSREHNSILREGQGIQREQLQNSAAQAAEQRALTERLELQRRLAEERGRNLSNETNIRIAGDAAKQREQMHGERMGNENIRAQQAAAATEIQKQALAKSEAAKNRAALVTAQTHFEDNPAASIEESAGFAGLDPNSPEFADLKRRLGTSTSAERGIGKYLKSVETAKSSGTEGPSAREIARGLMEFSSAVRAKHLDRLRAAGYDTNEIRAAIEDEYSSTNPVEYIPQTKIVRDVARKMMPGIGQADALGFLPRIGTADRRKMKRAEEALKVF